MSSGALYLFVQIDKSRTFICAVCQHYFRASAKKVVGILRNQRFIFIFLRIKVGTSRSSPLRIFTGVSSKNPRCSDISINLNSDCSAFGSLTFGSGLRRPKPKNPRDFFGLFSWWISAGWAGWVSAWLSAGIGSAGIGALGRSSRAGSGAPASSGLIFARHSSRAGAGEGTALEAT